MQYFWIMTIKLKYWVCLAWLCLIPCLGNAATPLIVASFSEALYLSSDGSVWGTGSVPGYDPGAVSPVRLFNNFPNVKSIATSSGNYFALLTDGTVWAYGSGLLGDGTTLGKQQPQQVPGLTGVTAISALDHVLALKVDGTVWAWGLNRSGQLGDGTTIDRASPIQVPGLSNVVRIVTAVDESIALKSDGTVWRWGAKATFCNSADTEMYSLIPTQLPGMGQIVDIAGGSRHWLGLRADGTVWGVGDNSFGQLGIGDQNAQCNAIQIPGLNNVVALQTRGAFSSLALKADGTVWGWGYNNKGQLGVAGATYARSPFVNPK